MVRILFALLISFGCLTQAIAEEPESIRATAASSSQGSSDADALAAAPASASDSAAVGEVHKLSSMLVRKFGLARAKAEQITQAVMASASKYSLPPALVLSIISIESRFKETARGAHGATGLMQVVPAAHRRLVQHVDLTQPAANIDAGSAILRGYIESAQGDVSAALKNYGGSSAYARKVSLHAREFELNAGASAVSTANVAR
jgi:soluble lytic murein transglycosylase-like protein